MRWPIRSRRSTRWRRQRQCAGRDARSISWSSAASTADAPAAAAKQAIGAGIKGAGRAAADFIPGVTPANPISQYGMTTAIYLYRMAFDFNDFGAASAMSWLLFFLVVLLTWLTNRAFKPRNAGG